MAVRTRGRRVDGVVFHTDRDAQDRRRPSPRSATGTARRCRRGHAERPPATVRAGQHDRGPAPLCRATTSIRSGSRLWAAEGRWWSSPPSRCRGRRRPPPPWPSAPSAPSVRSCRTPRWTPSRSNACCCARARSPHDPDAHRQDIPARRTRTSSGWSASARSPRQSSRRNSPTSLRPRTCDGCRRSQRAKVRGPSSRHVCTGRQDARWHASAGRRHPPRGRLRPPARPGAESPRGIGLPVSSDASSKDRLPLSIRRQHGSIAEEQRHEPAGTRQPAL